jgi:hypothetical protein
MLVLDFFSCFRLRAFRDWPLEDNGGDGLTRAANKLSFAGPISVLELDLFVGLPRWMGFYETVKGNLGLQLMSSVTADRDTKPLLPNGGTFLQQHGHHNAQHHPRHLHRPLDSGGASGGMPNEPSSVHMDFVRNEAWLLPSPHLYPRQPKVLHHLPVGPVDLTM